MKARGKGKVTRLRRLPTSAALQQALDRVPSSDLEVELSKARAAVMLLKAGTDYLQMPAPATPGEEGQIRAWIKGFAFEALDAALADAEAARRKIPLMRTRWPETKPKRKAVAA